MKGKPTPVLAIDIRLTRTPFTPRLARQAALAQAIADMLRIGAVPVPNARYSVVIKRRP